MGPDLIWLGPHKKGKCRYRDGQHREKITKETQGKDSHLHTKEGSLE